LIRKLEVTTATKHDSQVDLSEEGGVVYRGKSYFGVPAKGYDAMMKRSTGAGPISRERLRNVGISK